MKKLARNMTDPDARAYWEATFEIAKRATECPCGKQEVADAAIEWGVAWHAVMDETLREEVRKEALRTEKVAYERLKALTLAEYEKRKEGGIDG